MTKFYIIFDEAQYKELTRLILMTDDENLIYIKSYLENENNLWVGEVSFAKFIKAYFYIKSKELHNPLVRRFVELGKLQDGNFEMTLRFWERNFYSIERLRTEKAPKEPNH